MSTLPLPSINSNSLSYCTGNGQANTCLLNWGGYDWWTNYHWSQNSGIWVGGQNQIYDPNNIWADSAGLHLKVQQGTYGGKNLWASAEAVLYQELGYGKFVFTVTGLAAWMAANESNLVFGAFTFQPTANSNTKNQYIEVDALEVSRWGNPSGNDAGTAQFVVQPYDATPDNRHIIQLDPTKCDPLTIEMEWSGAGVAVTYNAYYGAYNTGSLPATPDITWITPASVLPYVPQTDGELFHFNFWQFGGQGPSDANAHELVITDFEFTAS